MPLPPSLSKWQCEKIVPLVPVANTAPPLAEAQRGSVCIISGGGNAMGVGIISGGGSAKRSGDHQRW
jgi:hypothetical protein